MTNLQKNDILTLIEAEKKVLSSYAKVATKCSVSSGTISQMVNGNHDLIKPEMWMKVGSALGYTIAEWQIAETMGFRKVSNICNDAKNERLFMILSEGAGVGKSESLKSFYSQHAEQQVYYIQCREWSKRDFLTELCRALGIDVGKHHLPIDKLGAKVTAFFSQKSNQRPLLLVDEADKLKDAALRWFIHLYNENDEKMGCVIAGTDHLEKRIRDGVRLRRLGFDELESRFGRSYLHLAGSTLKDIRLICQANGITNPQKQADIFKECGPVQKMVATAEGQQSIKVVEDLRRVKRIIKRERLLVNEVM